MKFARGWGCSSEFVFCVCEEGGEGGGGGGGRGGAGGAAWSSKP